jgi:hypothetical protein
VVPVPLHDASSLRPPAGTSSPPALQKGPRRLLLQSVVARAAADDLPLSDCQSALWKDSDVGVIARWRRPVVSITISRSPAD